MTYSAFEQFEIIRVIPIHPFGNLDISITNSTIFMGLAVGVFYFLYISNIKTGFLVPERWQSVLEIVYQNVYNIIKDNLGKEGNKFFPFIFTLFMFIAIMNMFGIVPYAFSVTSHMVITFGISLSIFLGCVILGLINFRSQFFAMFIPSGSPLGMAPFLVLVELISFVSRALSLGLRLAANITAGHLLLAIISGFAWTMLISGGFTSIAALFPIAILTFITVLEMAVALIQAYVFTLLTAIYINDAIHLH